VEVDIAVVFGFGRGRGPGIDFGCCSTGVEGLFAGGYFVERDRCSGGRDCLFGFGVVADMG
jgi:hypothetical protein